MRFWRRGGRRDRSGRRLCWRCSPTASQIDQLVLRSIIWVPSPSFTSFASIPLDLLALTQVRETEIVSAQERIGPDLQGKSHQKRRPVPLGRREKPRREPGLSSRLAQ